MYLAPVAHSIHTHDPDLIGNLVDDAVICHSDAPVIFAACELAAAGPRWIVCECLIRS